MILTSPYTVRAIGRELVVSPQEEPITLAEAKTHLSVDHTFHDSYITSLIVAARQQVESWTNRALITQRWRAYFSSFGNYMLLPRPSLRQLISVRYFGTDGEPVSVATTVYTSNGYRDPAYLTLAYGQTWPAASMRPYAPVEVTYEAGYGNADAVPAAIKQAMLMLIGLWYSTRESVALSEPNRQLAENAAHRLLDDYVVRGVE